MATVHLNKVQRQARINAVPAQQFYSKEIPISEEVKDAIERIHQEYNTMEDWMQKTYDAFLPNRQENVPEFPKELIHENKQAKKPRKKGGDEERVRARSSGDATAA